MSGTRNEIPSGLRRRRPSTTAVAVVVLCLLAACASDGKGPDEGATGSLTTGPTSAPESTPTTLGPVSEESVVVAAAGDISCRPGQAPTDAGCRMVDTAALVEAAAPAAVLTLGDNQYEGGSLEEFQESYDGNWGRFKDITRPSPGNHEYSSGRGRADGYFEYFGRAAGPPGLGWYSFDLEGWHLVALNSNCSLIGGCGPGSAQHEWLAADLAASNATCTLAYWHHPRFSSGYHGDDESVGPLWELLEAESAELVLGGHDHHYERFAAMAPDGTPDRNGIRQFVVGTGGRNLYPTLGARGGSEIRRSVTYGVLLLTLSPGSYRWAFTPAPGDTFTDVGEGSCN